jgi:hypothetical protein
VRPGTRVPSGALHAPGAGQHGLARRDKSRDCYLVYASEPTEEFEERPRPSGTALSRCWRKVSNRPVLKHGPRSLTCMRAGGWKTHEAQVT